MKWHAVMAYLNGGIVLICFGQMAHVNQCSSHLENTFFMSGGVGIAIAALIALPPTVVLMVEFARRWRKAKRAYVQTSKN